MLDLTIPDELGGRGELKKSRGDYFGLQNGVDVQRKVADLFR